MGGGEEAMEIRQLPLQAIPITNIVTARFSPGSSVALPVEANVLLYAHFKHISAVPAPAGTQGFSLERLRMLDNLIDRLVAANGHRAYVKDVAGLSANEMNHLITHYQDLLRRVSLQSSPAPYDAGRAPGPGVLLNFVA